MTNSKTLKAAALGAAVAAALTSGVAAAEVTANAAVTNNYMWRGTSLSNDQAAVQGGIDWGNETGFYVGTWLSNTDFSGDFGFGFENGTGYEMDVYAGFGREVGDNWAYDLGVVTYQFPLTPEINVTEIYGAGTFKVLTLGIYYTVDSASANKDGPFDKGDTYVYGSLDFATKPGDFSVYAGSYMFDNDQQFGNGELDYIHYGASWGKGDFTFAVDKNDIDDPPTADSVRFTVMWSKDFELM